MSNPDTTALVPLMGLSINPGPRDLVVPSVEELRALAPQWIRFLPHHQFQDFASGQNSELDWVLDRYRGLGVQVLVLFNAETLNAWPPRAGDPSWDDMNSGYIPRVADLAEKIATFYRNRIGAIEIINEPDNWIAEGVPQIEADNYGRLLAAAYQRVKAVGNVPVISGGIFDIGGDYLRRVVQVSKGAFDGVGLHPYGTQADGYPALPGWGRGDLRTALRKARTIGGKPVWVSELGADLKYTWPPGVSDEQGVADYLTRAFNVIRSLSPDTVAHTFWFTWKFPQFTSSEPNKGWGLVDDFGGRRRAWFAFQQVAQQMLQPPRAPAAPPAITAVNFSPTTLEQGQVLNVSITVRNNSDQTLSTQEPPPGFIYEEGESFASRGFSEVSGAMRVGVDFDGRTGVDHPYRWGLGSPLAPGQTTSISGGIRLKNAQSANFWAGLVREAIAWLQDQQGTQLITVTQASVDSLRQQVAQLQAQVAQLQQQLAQVNNERSQLTALLVQLKRDIDSAGL